MDLGPQSLSVFITLFLILAAMGVALLVDLLKGNNEQLRELAIELKAKKDAAERHIQSLESHAANLMLRQPALAGGNLMHEIGAEAPAPASRISTAHESAFSMKSTEHAGFHKAVRKGRDESQPRHEMSPAVAAVAESVAARMAAGRMGPMAAPVEPAFAAAAGSSEAAVEVRTGVFKSGGEVRKDWSRILTTKKHDVVAPDAITVEIEADDNLIHMPAIVVEAAAGLPAGFHEYAVLRKAAEAGLSLRGMVVAIGTNSMDAGPLEEVANFVRTLLAPADFGCQSGPDEFVLVCTAEALAAQQRLSEIAERLWDFQLRSMGHLNVQFAWGGMEARGADKLNDVVAAAVDQMTETRRARRGSGTVRIAQAG